MIGTVARRTLAAKARPAAASNETIAVSSQPLPSTVRRAGGTASDRGRGWRTGATRVICRRGTATGSFGTRTGLRAAVRMGLERRTATRRCLAVGCAVRERDAGGTANRVERGGAVARVERGAATRRAAVGGTGATVRCLGRGTTVSAPAEADEDRPRGGAAADGAGSAGAGSAGFGAAGFGAAGFGAAASGAVVASGADSGPVAVVADACALAGACPLAGAGTAGAGAAAAGGGAAG